jgi:hypothetical protein
MFRRTKFGGYTVNGVRVRQAKNRGAQLVLFVALVCSAASGVLAGVAPVGKPPFVVAICVCAASSTTFLAVFVRALRTWDY